jgi:hypothetical protein
MLSLIDALGAACNDRTGQKVRWKNWSPRSPTRVDQAKVASAPRSAVPGLTPRGSNAAHRTRFPRGRRERSRTARLALHLLGWRPARSAERPRRRDHRAGDPGVGGSFRICPPGRARRAGPGSDPARIESRTPRGRRSPRPNRARGPTSCPMRPDRERQRLPAPTSAPAHGYRSGARTLNFERPSTRARSTRRERVSPS